MLRRYALVLLLPVIPVLYSAVSEYASAKRKFEMIGDDRLRPGTRVTLTPGELNAYVLQESKDVLPDGVRNPKLVLGNGVATGSALIDFGQVRRAQGKSAGWMLSRLLEGERPVTVTANIRSGNGQMTVDVQRVEISGIELDGKMLDFLIRHYLQAVYPQAKVGVPFRIGHRVERVDVRPSDVAVAIGR